MAEFDEYAEGYSGGMENPLKRIIANDAGDFLKPKVRIIKNLFSSGKKAKLMLDYGCGSGEFLKLLSDEMTDWELIGTDVSMEMMSEAKKRHCVDSEPFVTESIETALQSCRKYDVITACCVFHHIPPCEWTATIERLANSLSENGSLVIIEHNPINPITRWVVSRTEIDKNAVLLSPKTTLNLLQKAGLKIHKSKSFMFIPPAFRISTAVDRILGLSMLGGQYYIVAQKNQCRN